MSEKTIQSDDQKQTVNAEVDIQNNTKQRDLKSPFSAAVRTRPCQGRG